MKGAIKRFYLSLGFTVVSYIGAVEPHIGLQGEGTDE